MTDTQDRPTDQPRAPVDAEPGSDAVSQAPQGEQESEAVVQEPMPSAKARLLTTDVMRRALVHAERGPAKTRPPIRAARTVAAPVQKAAAPVLKAHRKPERELAAAWREIVGDTLAHMTRPEHYQPGQGASNNGILTIKVAGALGLDIQHLEPQIIDRVNTYFGYRAIARLKIVQGPLPGAANPLSPERPRHLDRNDQATLSACSKDVKDPGLRQALEALGRDLFARRPPEE